MTAEIASQIVLEHYGFTVKASALQGDEDENFKVVSENGNTYLLKVAVTETDDRFLQFQTAVLEHLASKKTSCQFSEILLNKEGKPLTSAIISEEKRTARLLTWLPGRLWAHVNPKTSKLRFSLGEKAGEITTALQNFQHPQANRSFDWNLADALWTEKYTDLFKDIEKDMVSFFQERFQEIQLVYQSLPKSVVHNDVNDHNIIVSSNLKNPEVTGIIDFGDAVYTQTINDLAITIAYAIMNTPDPLAAAVEIVQGYHSKYKLSEKELECLYTLVGMRLVITVTKAALRRADVSQNVYHFISEHDAWQLLKHWYGTYESFVLYNFRNACDYTPHPKEYEFKEWVVNNKISLNTLFPSLKFKNVTHVDMSIGSTWLGNKEEYSDTDITAYKLKQIEAENPESILANGYMEVRPFYTTKAFRMDGNNGPQYRTVHLGTDFWVAAKTPLHAAYDGKVVILHHNNYLKDYGPLMVLEHEFEGNPFYTLYGHLTLSSLELTKIGQEVKQGELIGYIGDASENGIWTPHLHFQVMLDLLGNTENFPGVAFPSEQQVWKSICQNPGLLFTEETQDTPEKISDEEIIDFRKEHLGKSLSLSYSEPLHIVRGEGVYLIDSDGKKYIDTANNVNHVGHQHPKVVAAGQQQMAVLNTNTRYLHKEIINYAEALLKKLPKELSVLHFVNSGSEANELALRMAKTVTGQENMLAIEVGYHGNTNAVMDVSSYKFDGKGGFPQPANTHILPLPDIFRGKHCGKNAGTEYANYATRHIEHLRGMDKGIAGFIGESMISCGGQIVPPKNYFKKVYKTVREAGGICIADEVQTGFGRMGKTFWAFELFDVVPDIVTMGKPAGNGHPLAVVACTKEISEKFHTGMEFFNTFGGNPVSCAIGRTVLEVIEEENLQQNALETGAFLKSGLLQLQKESPIIGDVRGEGLFLGFELTDNNKNPLAEHAAYLSDRMKTLGVLMSTDGPDYNVLKIKPPVVFNKEHAQELIDKLRIVFGEDFMKAY
ncbi:aminotransferase class III-fold pyridoxal phosphate-dependent enzyme [Marixanthomonas spongiae]|uniref:Peptidase M23 n=1 Tax=Marixanthomonas spongiae TaxID=2174845 RepID=A0A2U0I897_9FLAO|nr:aminotransferase class III-fold pyridoxal phosphate-dependent enzyme [Marixanthomonas spongiae]PVW17335.1 peptidase M23 [Marixanthomonas spongiae]